MNHPNECQQQPTGSFPVQTCLNHQPDLFCRSQQTCDAWVQKFCSTEDQRQLISHCNLPQQTCQWFIASGGSVQTQTNPQHQAVFRFP